MKVKIELLNNIIVHKLDSNSVYHLLYVIFSEIVVYYCKRICSFRYNILYTTDKSIHSIDNYNAGN